MKTKPNSDKYFVPAQNAATLSRKWNRTTSFDRLTKYVCPSQEHATTSSVPSPCTVQQNAQTSCLHPNHHYTTVDRPEHKPQSFNLSQSVRFLNWPGCIRSLISGHGYYYWSSTIILEFQLMHNLIPYKTSQMVSIINSIIQCVLGKNLSICKLWWWT